MQLPDPDPTPDDATRRAERILERPEFDELEPTLADRVIDWIAEQVGRAFGDVVGGGGGGAFGWVLVLVLTAAVVVLLARAARTFQRSAAVDDAVVDEEVRRPPEDWRRLAREHEAAARWRESVVATYRQVVATLVRAGIASDLAGRTTGEYRRDVARRAPAVAADFVALSDLFDAVWFGDLPASADDVRTANDLASSILGTAVREQSGRLREQVG